MSRSPGEELEPSPWLADLGFPEGLRWRAGELWFSDIVRETVLSCAPDGRPQRRAVVPGRPSGLGFAPDGALVVASMRDRLVLRSTAAGTDTLADLSYHASRAINDMLVDGATGNAYVGAYGETDQDGAVVLVRPDGRAEVVVSDISYPNGLVVLPGTRDLVVADTVRRELRLFALRPDGALADSGLFASLPEHEPDGLCVDAAGAVWVASYSTGEFLRVERGGRTTHRVDVGDRWALACALGGPDGQTLYIATAQTTRERFGAGDSEGWIGTVPAPVPAAP